MRKHYPETMKVIDDERYPVYISTNVELLAGKVLEFTGSQEMADRYKGDQRKDTDEEEIRGSCKVYSRCIGDTIIGSLHLIHYKKMSVSTIPHELIHFIHALMFLSIDNPSGFFLRNKNLEEGLTTYQNIPFIEDEIKKLRDKLDGGDKTVNRETLRQDMKMIMKISRLEQELKDEREYMQKNLRKAKLITKNEFMQRVKTMHGVEFYNMNKKVLDGFHQTWVEVHNPEK